MGHAENMERSLRSTETLKSRMEGPGSPWASKPYNKPELQDWDGLGIPGSDSDLDSLKNHHFYVDGLIVCRK